MFAIIGFLIVFCEGKGVILRGKAVFLCCGARKKNDVLIIPKIKIRECYLRGYI